MNYIASVGSHVPAVWRTPEATAPGVKEDTDSRKHGRLELACLTRDEAVLLARHGMELYAHAHITRRRVGRVGHAPRSLQLGAVNFT